MEVFILLFDTNFMMLTPVNHEGKSALNLESKSEKEGTEDWTLCCPQSNKNHDAVSKEYSVT